MVTMNEKYNDGTNCLVCVECGLCIDHGDCRADGCGKEVGKPAVLASPVDLLVMSEGTKRHPKCKGRKYLTDCGYEYDCDYETMLTCDECKYGCGRKDPEAKCNSNT